MTTDTVYIGKIDESFVVVSAEPGIQRDISNNFKFRVPNYMFMPLYKSKVWDGYHRLYNSQTGMFPIGLVPKLIDFLNRRGYDYSCDFSPPGDTAFTNAKATEFFKSLNLPAGLELRDYQISGLEQAVKNSRSVLISATGSGKSLIIYSILKYYDLPTLMIVPTIALVSQMKSDLIDYSPGQKKFHNQIETLFSGEKISAKPQVLISTWQSLVNKSSTFLSRFKVVIADEVHQYKLNEISDIIDRMQFTPYRFGTTGTLDNEVIHSLKLEGMFGPICKISTAKDLIDKGVLSQLNIKMITLKHTPELCKLAKSLNYAGQNKLIFTLKQRNEFIARLANELKGNTLVLFREVKNHGRLIQEIFKTLGGEKEVHWVSGEVEGVERERIRKIVETSTNAIILASEGTFSVGINIKSLDNLIFASATKARIRIVQSIGRILRKSKSSSKATVYDIVDDLTWACKGKRNYSLQHAAKRRKTYKDEQYNFKLKELTIQCHAQPDVKKHLLQKFGKQKKLVAKGTVAELREKMKSRSKPKRKLY